MTPQTLLDHNDSGQPWPASVPSAEFGDLPTAYQQALAVRALRQARGEQARGYKIGFTNRQIWQRYAVFAPIWGTVWASTLQFCEGTGRVSVAGLCQPRIEPEAVFGIKATPDPQTGLQGLLQALDWVAPGFEIVQSHRPAWKFTAPETVADGGLHARLLVGRRVCVQGLAADVDALNALLAGASVSLQCGARAVEQGQGANVLDSPLLALQHFVNELRLCPGAPTLQAGDVVTTGTWTDAWPVLAGQTWRGLFSSPLSALRIDLV